MIIFDLDCLADDSHRRHFIENPYSCFGEAPDCNCSDPQREFSCPFDDYNSWKPDYKAYDDAGDKDEINLPVAFQFYSLREKFGILHPIHVWCNKYDFFRGKTIDWLQRYFTRDIKWVENLKMRPNDNNEPQEMLFESWVDHFATSGKPIEFVFSKHKPTVEMFRRRGIFVFDCGQE